MQKEFRTGILTISDKGARGEREDTSGETAASILEENGYYFLDMNPNLGFLRCRRIDELQKDRIQKDNQIHSAPLFQ